MPPITRSQRAELTPSLPDPEALLRKRRPSEAVDANPRLPRRVRPASDEPTRVRTAASFSTMPAEVIGRVVSELAPEDAARLGATNRAMRAAVLAQREHDGIVQARALCRELTQAGPRASHSVSGDQIERLREIAHHLPPEDALRVAEVLLQAGPHPGQAGTALGALLGRRDRADEAQQIAERLDSVRSTPWHPGGLSLRTVMLSDILNQMGPASHATYQPFLDRMRDYGDSHTVALSYNFLPDSAPALAPRSVRDEMATLMLAADRTTNRPPSSALLFERLRHFSPPVQQAVLQRARELRASLGQDAVARHTFTNSFHLEIWGVPDDVRPGLQGVPHATIEAWRDFASG